MHSFAVVLVLKQQKPNPPKAAWSGPGWSRLCQNPATSCEEIMLWTFGGFHVWGEFWSNELNTRVDVIRYYCIYIYNISLYISTQCWSMLLNCCTGEVAAVLSLLFVLFRFTFNSCRMLIWCFFSLTWFHSLSVRDTTMHGVSTQLIV